MYDPFEDEENGRTRKEYVISYIVTLIILILTVSILTDGFTQIVYYAIQPLHKLNYTYLSINITGGISFLLLTINYWLERKDRTDWVIGILDSTVDVVLVILILLSGYWGFIYPFIILVLAIWEIIDDEKYSIPFLLSVIISIPIIVLGLVGVLYSNVAGSHHISAVTIESPLEVYGIYRIIPLYTAHTYGLDRIQVPTHTIYLEDSYLYYNGSEPVYNWIIEPEGFINSITKKPKGLVLVYGDKYPPHVVIVRKELKYGLRNMYFKGVYFDSLDRQAKMRSIGKEILLDENIEKVYNGHIYIIIPVITWERSTIYSIPIPDSYIIVDDKGDIRTETYKEALGDPLFKGIPLIPEKVARSWVEIYNYHNGFTEYYFHHNHYKIPDIGENPQPYLTISKNGTLYWSFVVEPSGDTYSVRHIIYINARSHTLKPKLIIYTPNETLIGVSKVESYVQSQHPNYDWNKLKVVEPIPTVTNDTIYWKLSVITNDYRGLVAIDLVNAKTSKITTIKVASGKGVVTPQEILRIIEGQEVNETESQPRNMSITEEIKQLKQQINQTINQLNQMYQKLNKLEELLENQTNS